MCKPWKSNGFGKRVRKNGEQFGSHRNRVVAAEKAKEAE